MLIHPEKYPRFSRPTEDIVLNMLDHEERVRTFLCLLTPQQFSAVAAVASGMSQSEVANAFGVSRNVISRRIKRAREDAINVFGEMALRGRELVKQKQNQDGAIKYEHSLAGSNYTDI